METLLLSVRFELLSLDMVGGRESLLAKLQELQSNPRNYDIWFDFVRLEESYGELDLWNVSTPLPTLCGELGGCSLKSRKKVASMFFSSVD